MRSDGTVEPSNCLHEVLPSWWYGEGEGVITWVGVGVDLGCILRLCLHRTEHLRRRLLGSIDNLPMDPDKISILNHMSSRRLFATFNPIPPAKISKIRFCGKAPQPATVSAFLFKHNLPDMTAEIEEAFGRRKFTLL